MGGDGGRMRCAPMRQRGQRGRREHDEHHRAERKGFEPAGVAGGQEQEHRDEAARRDPHQLRDGVLPQEFQDDEARRKDDRDAGDGDQPRLDRHHLLHVGPVAQEQEEEALAGERELGDQPLEFLQRLRVVVGMQRAQLRVPRDEVRVVDEEAADEHDDQRRQVQLLADRVQEDEAGQQRQEADVADDLVDEVLKRERGDHRDDDGDARRRRRGRARILRAIPRAPATRRTRARRGCRTARIRRRRTRAAARAGRRRSESPRRC